MLYIVCLSILMSCTSGNDFSTREHSKRIREFPFGLMEGNPVAAPRRGKELDSVYDPRESMDFGLEPAYKESFFEDDDGHQFRDHRKKSDSRPKYDPGWKFIGLGKRPEDDLSYAPEMVDARGGVNPLLGISTLVNFEFFNAIRDGIEGAARETVKKEDSIGSDGLSGSDSGSLRFNNKVNYFGRQRSMYDPGWMLTGLGK